MTTIAKIANIKSQLSPSEQKIATLVLQQPSLVVSLSSQQFAQKADVSQSSIVKFTQKIGFKGFPAFKLAINEEIILQQADGKDDNQQHQYQPYKNQEHQQQHQPQQQQQQYKPQQRQQPQQQPNQIASDESFKSTAQQLAQEKINSIIETTQAIDDANLKQIITLLNNARRIQLIGLGSSALVAKDFSCKLLRIGLIALSEQDSHSQISIAKTLDHHDVQLAISHSGNHKEVLLAANTAKLKGAKLIVITAPDDNPLRLVADYCLDTIAEQTTSYGQPKKSNNIVSPLTAQHTITDLLFRALIQTRENTMHSQLADTQSFINNLSY